jgi:hypothetical protein
MLNLVSPISFGCMPPKTIDVREPLHALTKALEEAGLTATLEREGQGAELFVRVINPDAPTYRDRIRVLHHDGDNHAPWFFHSWRDPISPADDIGTAVADIRKTLTPRVGARDVRP